MYTITSRSPTENEIRIVNAQGSFDFASYGCLVIFFGIVPAFMLSSLGRWLGSFVSKDAGTVGQWIGYALAAILLVGTSITFIPFERRRHRRAAGDKKLFVVEDIHVVTIRVVEIGLISDNEPILAFEMDHDKILYLQGQWLRDAETYGVQPLDGDPYEEFVNGLPAPNSFPSAEFTVARLPSSGRVLSVKVQGDYLAPAQTVEALKPEYEFGDCELMTGRLEEIENVLVREHASRSDM